MSSLPGDRKKRKQALDKIISTLKAKREEFRKEKKTGAGSATEAIDFYKYVLEKNAKWKESGSENSNSNAADDHNDLGDDSRCKICNLGGDLYHCSQNVCQNAFHLECMRPIPDEDLPVNWSCAFCDVDYVTGLKPQSRKRREAVVAVQEMEKLKSEYDSDVRTSNKRKFDDLDDSPNSSRSKRQRRLTIKQSIDDDNNNDSKASSQPEVPMISKDEIPFEVLKRLSPKNINSNSKHGQFHCKYCMDDENTEACCFCACRVCFSKRDRTSTILCDICDSEYHMDCLSPPLLSLPSTDWFCPTCVNVIMSSKVGKGGRKGMMTTPFKSPNKVKSKVTKASTKLAMKAKAIKSNQSLLKASYASKQPRLPCGRFAPKKLAEPPEQPVKRGPGRPPKNSPKVQIAPPPKKLVPKKAGTGRPRGRPPKTKKIKEISSSDMHNTATPDVSISKALRSSTKPTPPKKTGTGRPRGRPPKRSRLTVNNETDTNFNKVSGESGTKSSPFRTRRAKTVSSITHKQQNSKELMSEDNLDISQQAESKLTEVEVRTEKALTTSDEVKPIITEADKPFASDFELKQNREESVSVEEMKQAEAAAVKAVASTTIIHVEDAESQKTQSTASAVASISGDKSSITNSHKVPRRKPGARECLQISRRFGANIIPQNYMQTLLDYCTRGKVEHLIRMRERLDEHARFLELQLAGLEMMIREKGGQEPAPVAETCAETNDVSKAS